MLSFSYGRLFLPGNRHELFHGGQNPLNDDRNALFIRMNTIRLIEPWVSGNAIQKKRIKYHPVPGP